MKKEISSSAVYDVLSGISHPEMPDRHLVELGMVQAVGARDGRIAVTLAFPSLEAPILKDLVKTVEEAVQGLSPDIKVSVTVAEMDDAKKAAFGSIFMKERAKPRVSRQINHTIAVMSGKGGVGKSSVAVLLASTLRRRGFRVGVLDADITGPSIPMMFGAQHRPEMGPEGILPVESSKGTKIMSINLLLPDTDQPVIWRGPMISNAIEQFWRDILWGDLDFLVVDLPPGTADATLTVMQALPLDGIVLVTTPQDLAGMVVRKGANMAVQLKIPLIGLVENMSHAICPECGTRIDVFGESRADEVVRLIGVPLLGRMPLDPEIAKHCDRGEIEDYRGDEVEEIVDGVMDYLSVAMPELDA